MPLLMCHSRCATAPSWYPSVRASARAWTSPTSRRTSSDFWRTPNTMTAEYLNAMRVMLEGQEGHSYANILRVACTSEKLGFGGMFRSDHWLPIMGDRQIDATDAWATLAGLARDTTSILFGTLVSPMTFRHPSELAKQAATIDQMSGGRVEVGFGAGWYDGEHAAYGIPFPPLKERFDRLEESLEVCTRLWGSASSASFDGRYYKLDNAPG